MEFFKKIRAKKQLHYIIAGIVVVIVAAMPNLLDLYSIIVFGLILLVSYFIHEYSHIAIAKSYGAEPDYRLWGVGFLASFVVSIASLGFIKAILPGRMKFSTKDSLDKIQMLKISGFGILASLLISIGASFINIPLVRTVALFNSWLAVINLTPLKDMDGQKIWEGNKFVYIVLAALSIVFLIVNITASSPLILTDLVSAFFGLSLAVLATGIVVIVILALVGIKVIKNGE